MNMPPPRPSVTKTRGEHPDISYLDVGARSAPAVVLLHSLGADHRMWRPQVEVLSADYRVIAPDSRGHGASVGGGPPSVDAWVGDLHRVLLDAGVERAALVGVSLGGIQAIAYAAAHPDRVAALVVADSFVELDQDVAQAKIAELSEQAEREGMAAVADRYVEDTFLMPPSPAGADDIHKAIAGMSVGEYVASVRVCFGVRIADRLAQVSAPTLVLWGARDEKTPRPLSERISAGISGAKLIEVPGAGHLSNVENPQHFTELAARFIRRHQGRMVHHDMKGTS